MSAAVSLGQVLCGITQRILDVPGLYLFPIKFIDDNFEIFIWADKHVVGAVEHNALFIEQQQLVQLGTASSGVHHSDIVGVSFPFTSVGKFNDVAITDQRDHTFLGKRFAESIQSYLYVLISQEK